MVLSLSVSLQAATVSFHTTAPTPGPYDVYNFVGATRDANNVGTTPYDSWLNDEWTYLAIDRAAQGQTFLTGSSNPVYLLTGFWIQHVGYTENTASGTNNNGTWYSIPLNSRFGIRITDPAASGTVGFVLGSETYTVTRNEADILPAGVTNTANGTGTWVHFVLDSPIPVAANKTYGFDVVSMTGNPNMFFEILGIKDDSPEPPGNPYPAGTAYRSGASGKGNNVLTVAPGDRVFVVELVGAPPPSASIPYPADKATGVQTDPVLSWNAGFDSTESKVYFGTSPSSLVLQTTITHTQGVDRYSYPVTGLAYNQVYYWRVDEVPQTGPDVTGNIWSFTTGTIKASNPNPYDNEICVFIDPDTNLSWKAGLNSTQSKVYFGTSLGSLVLQTTITHTQGVDRYSYTVTSLANDQDYYWRVDQVPQTGPDITGDLWHFRTIPIIPVTDPTLVGWWKFDEGQGKAIDWSGLNQHGTVYGDAASVAGYDGGAIEFDYVDNYVELPIGSTIASLNSATIATWVTFPGTGETFQRIFNFGYNDATVYIFLTPNNGSGVPRFAITTTGSGAESGVDAPNALTSGWHHVAVTINEATHIVELYLDGAVVATGSTQTMPSDLGNTTYNWLGRSDDWVPPNPYLIGSLDDFRIYNYALSQEEINTVMRVDPLRAWNPKPVIGRVMDLIDAETELPLSWSPGDEALHHNVYFGTDYAAVDAADASDTTGIYRGQQDANNYTPPEGVERGQTYYWRIDEINPDATISEGRIWSFTIADYLIVDDFEDYNNNSPDKVFQTWIDGLGYTQPPPGVPGNGTGSTVGHDIISLDSPYYQGNIIETSIVHVPGQSMPMDYNNVNDPFISEAIRTWDTPQDWTAEGVAALTIWFRGYRQSVGGISYNAATQTYTMTGAGADIYELSDEFHYAYKQLSGEGSITAKVESLTEINAWSKAGVMIRETLDADSAQVLVSVTPQNGVEFMYRLAGDTTTAWAEAGLNAPHWLRIRRVQNDFFAEHSTDNVTWVDVQGDNPSSANIPMSVNTYIGLHLCSHEEFQTAEAVFSNVRIIGDVTPTGPFTQSQDIGILSNDADRFYVILEDDDDNSHLVEYPEPNATQIYEWQDFNIDMREFTNAGVNTAAITKMTLGVGNKAAPASAGTGSMYFDDIRLHWPRCVPSQLQPVGDLNDDCVVNYSDIDEMAGEWLSIPAPGAELIADLDGDGDVDFSDYAELASAWLEERIWPVL